MRQFPNEIYGIGKNSLDEICENRGTSPTENWILTNNFEDRVHCFCEIQINILDFSSCNL